MSILTNIEWCHSTWSPWLGCRKVSPACRFCYITATPAFRFRGLKHGEPRQRTSESYWKDPLKWNRQAGTCLHCGFIHSLAREIDHCGGYERLPQRPRIFPSLCDWLDDEVRIEWLADFLKLIHDTPNLDWLLLTKRPENFNERFRLVSDWSEDNGAMDLFNWIENEWFSDLPPANVWIGVSIEDQQRAEERIPELLEIPAKLRFLSVEPLLGPVSLEGYLPDGGIALAVHGKLLVAGPSVDWVIVGGESGPGARPCNVQWIEDILVQCGGAGVPCFVKQLGSNPTITGQVIGGGLPDELIEAPIWPGGLKHKKGGDPSEWPYDLRVREFPQC